MSVPPRLASKLNESLGPDAAGDLVTWLDEMRAERADFAELRQEMRAMGSRLEEKLGDRIHALEVSLRSEIHAVETRLGEKLGDQMHGVEMRLGDRIGGVETKLGDRISGVETKLGDRIGSVETKLGDRMGSVETKLGDRIGGLSAEVERSAANLIRWSFVFWVGAVAAIAVLAGVLQR